MSYILEALKKAQAERAHGAVPGVDAQPVPTIAPRAPVSMQTWVITVLVLLALCAALYWLGPWTRQEPALPMVATRAPEAVSAPAQIASTPPAQTASRPAAPKAITVPDPQVKAAPVPAPAPAKPLRKLGERAPGEPAAVAPPQAPAPAPAPAPERIAMLQELPAQIQREIPTLAINGYIYASNPADRSVLINNRLRREGDTLADGFVLEKLLPREMVLNYRGYRYRVSY
jgi:general secretion pathway protein B